MLHEPAPKCTINLPPKFYVYIPSITSVTTFATWHTFKLQAGDRNCYNPWLKTAYNIKHTVLNIPSIRISHYMFRMQIHTKLHSLQNTKFFPLSLGKLNSIQILTEYWIYTASLMASHFLIWIRAFNRVCMRNVLPIHRNASLHILYNFVLSTMIILH